VLRALGDGTRLAIFRLVASGRRPVCVRNVVDRLSVSQPTVSHHLKVLRGAGLVAVTRRGTSSWISPVPGGLDPVRRAVGDAPTRGKGGRR
jgi:ArsR family transcriptional regulator